MIEDRIKSDYIFENEYCYVTSDGKLYQKDNKYFKGRELGNVDTDKVSDSIKIFEKAFSDLKEEVTTVLSGLENLGEDSEILQKFTDLKDKVESIDGVGDFEELISEIENKKNEMEKVIEAAGGEESDMTAAAEQEVADSGQSDEKQEIENTDEKSEETAPVPENKEVEEVEKKEETEETDPEKIADKTEDKEEAVTPTETGQEETGIVSEEQDEEESTTANQSDEVTSEEKEEIVEETKAESVSSADEEIAKDSKSEETTGKEDVSPEAKSEEPQKPEKDEEPAPEIEVPEELSEYLELVKKAEEISGTRDWQYTSLEFDNLRHKWSESPAVGDEHSEIYKALNKRFQDALEAFNERKSRHYDEVNRQKLKNVERKRNLLERLEKIINEKKWHASNEVKGIEKRWENVRLVPAEESEQLEKHYKQLKDVFEQNRVEYLVQRKQKEEDNLAGKMLILDKIELLVKKLDDKVGDWKSIEEEYQELQREWKKVGRVPREKATELWQRFKELRSDYIEKKLEFDESYRKKIDENKKKKLSLCEEAEALIDEPDLAKAARSINKLHKRWKETGPVPRDLAEELWQRFKTASDSFNKKKAENIEILRQQEKENYEKKLELCARAEAIQDTENWNEGTRVMQNLMDDWKKIGPVPRRKTRKVWKRFKKSMDTFYQRKRDYYKELRNEQKENLRKKREIIEKIEALGNLEDPQEAVKQAKPLQEEFAKIGFVPLKHKNKIYKHYREACDVVYQRSRASRSEGSGDSSYSGGLDSDTRKQLKHKQAQFSKIRRECEQLQDTILNYSDTKTFIKPNKKGIKLRDEIQSKIDAAQKELESKQDEMESLRQEIDEIRNGD